MTGLTEFHIAGQRFEAPALAGGLYIVATPIGNLKDITLRALETLAAVDLVLCEDTRHSATLLEQYGIRTPRQALHEHNERERVSDILRQLADGRRIALISDAGTPLISDPGYKLVREARDAGVAVFPIPGACAAIAALSAAGAPSDQFHFAGFLPAKPGARMRVLDGLATIDATLIFYETAPRLSASLTVMAEKLGLRRAIVAREITKMHEEFREGLLDELAVAYGEMPPKGEIVIVVFPPEPLEASARAIDAFLVDALKTLSVKEAASAAADALGVPRKEAYARALVLKSDP